MKRALVLLVVVAAGCGPQPTRATVAPRDLSQPVFDIVAYEDFKSDYAPVVTIFQHRATGRCFLFARGGRAGGGLLEVDRALCAAPAVEGSDH